MLYFPHIPKCGGTTIKHLFYSAVGIDNCLKIWNRSFGADYNPDEFVELESGVFSSVKAIVGHLPFKQALKNRCIRTLYEKGIVQAVSVVRDPLDRVVSLFNYMRANKSHPGHSRVREFELEKFAFNQRANFQTAFLRAHDGESVESICSRMYVFPIEQSELRVRQWLEETISQRVNPVRKANITVDAFPDSTQVKSIELNPHQVSAFTQKHYQDYELYNLSKRAHGKIRDQKETLC